MQRIVAAAVLATWALGCSLDFDGLAVGVAATSSTGASSASTSSGGGTSTDGAGAASDGGAGVGGTAASGGGTAGASQRCGDGTAEGDEQCDDANVISGDGCSDACEVECSGSGEVLDPTSLHCYFVSLDEIIWQDAFDACASRASGWDLAALSTVGEIALLAPHLPETNYFWLGGNDFATEGTFAWTNGEPWSYVDGDDPWENASEPNDAGGAEDCVRTSGASFKLNDDGCHKWANGPPIGHVCERPPAGKP